MLDKSNKMYSHTLAFGALLARPPQGQKEHSRNE